MITKEESLRKIQSLVERFDEQKESYKKADYNETQTRQDFINPFWKALGWDVDNENGYAKSYREVIHEDRVKVGGATKSPDYTPQYIVEYIVENTVGALLNRRDAQFASLQ